MLGSTTEEEAADWIEGVRDIAGVMISSAGLSRDRRGIDFDVFGRC